MIEKLGKLKAESLVITDQSNPDALALGELVIGLPFPVNELFTPIPYIVPAQLLAAHLAEKKGFNPDQPRTLSKVTRTL
jgi:glucosamine--fructose-6-phosphate aminotransferase (isomerizing)